MRRRITYRSTVIRKKVRSYNTVIIKVNFVTDMKIKEKFFFFFFYYIIDYNINLPLVSACEPKSFIPLNLTLFESRHRIFDKLVSFTRQIELPVSTSSLKGFFE